MSGHRIHTDTSNKDRRTFVKQLLAFASLPVMAAWLKSCNTPNTYNHINGSIVGANHKTGHLLRTPEKIPEPSAYIDIDILIAGGGISGLSAKRWLQANGMKNVMMIEMDKQVGGNATYGQNAISAYPWAAHYLPVPDNDNTDLIAFLQSAGVITGFDNKGLPVYNEYHLCHDPEERLYINGHWQEGLIPDFGVSQHDKQQIKHFMDYVEKLKHEKGEDGKYHFAIPVDNCSASTQYKSLDNISFATFLKQKGYTSPYLLWYLEYCCKDDYGSLLQQTSAWAGLHYFASRRGNASNASSSDVLTWPEGNGYLMNALKRQCGENMHTGMMIYKADIVNNKAEVFCYDVNKQASVCIRANKLLLCTPQYITKKVLTTSVDPRNGIYKAASYAPWIVANISLDDMPQGKGAPLSWDNVIYGRHTVGYVYANHQDIHRSTKGVITFYLPVTADDATKARHSIYNKDHEYWKKYVVKELEFAHPGITSSIKNIDVCIWGHGMIRPDVGYIWGSERQQAMQPIDNKIFFAHSDLSGISIFEEAFYQGIRAAKQMLGTV